MEVHVNIFGWLMATGGGKFTRFVVIDHVFILIEKDRKGPWLQSRYVYASAEVARNEALVVTGWMDRWGYEMIGSVNAVGVHVNHRALERECANTRHVGDMLSFIINTLDTSESA